MSLEKPQINGYDLKSTTITINTDRDINGLWQRSRMVFDNKGYAQNLGAVQQNYTEMDIMEIEPQDAMDLERILTKIYCSEAHQRKLGADGFTETLPELPPL